MLPSSGRPFIYLKHCRAAPRAMRRRTRTRSRLAPPWQPQRDLLAVGVLPFDLELEEEFRKRVQGIGVVFEEVDRRGAAEFVRSDSAEAARNLDAVIDDRLALHRDVPPAPAFAEGEPERLAYFTAAPPARRQAQVRAELRALFGEDAGAPLAQWERHWGQDPYALGYVTQWAPGDVLAVGPRHGTHTPPVYFCGSDQWVAGYMEGAVRTGRAAAAAALAGREA